jgi:hypothetical protein
MNYRKMPSGYGMVLLSVMTDENLTIEAKAIYALLCSYTGTKNCCFPKVETICKSLNISIKRYYKHMSILVESGLIVKDKLYQHDIRNNNKYIVMFPENTDEQDHISQEDDCQCSQNVQVDTGQNDPVNNSNIINSNTINYIYSNSHENPNENAVNQQNKAIQKLQPIIEHWNSLNIKIHNEKTITRNIANKHTKVLSKYTEQEIKQAISNYNSVLKHPNSYFTKVWTLWEFLTRERALPLFTDDVFSLKNYLKSKCRVTAPAESEQDKRERFLKACQQIE